MVTQVGERLDQPVRGIPGDVAWYAYACSQCGYCVDECDQFYGRGWESQSPRGKWYWLREFLEGRADWDQKMVDTFLVCTTCELCNVRCSASLPIEPSWMKLRGKLVHEDKQMTFPPFEMMAAATQAEGNIWAGYRKNRSDWFPAGMKAKHGPGTKARNVYFGGCTISFVENDMGQAAVTLLDAAGVDFAYLGNVENCCGTPMLVAGKWDVFAETMKKNIAAVKAAGADTVISSCPACNMMWRHVYPEWAAKLGIEYGITAKHYSELLADQIRNGQFKFTQPVNKRVTWHDSCHIGRVSGVYEEPRDVIKAIPGVEFREMEHHHEAAHCCGSVLTLIKEPLVAHDIGEMRLDEARAVDAETVLALCPCCEFQLRVSKDKKDVPIEVRDLAVFACEGLGRKFADPMPEVLRQWAVFEGMIALMSPKGFAGLMDSLWPELLKAMPLGMGGMMKGIGKLGPVGGLMFAADETGFSGPFPEAPARHDAQGHARHARADRPADPDARLYGRADARDDAQGHGQPDAPHAAGRRVDRRAQDDFLPARPRPEGILINSRGSDRVTRGHATISPARKSRSIRASALSFAALGEPCPLRLSYGPLHDAGPRPA